MTGAIIGAAIQVHRFLGPGLLESAYQECLAEELRLRGLTFEQQKPVKVHYVSRRLECAYRLDFVVEDRAIVELKSVQALAPIHEAQMLTYLRLTGHKLGLLMNFNVPTMHDGIRRLILDR